MSATFAPLASGNVDRLRTAPALGRLRDGLRSAGYSLDGIRGLLRIKASDSELLSKSALYSSMFGDELSSERSTLGTLIQLFFLGGRVSQEAVAHSLSRELRGCLESFGLVRALDGGLLEATVAITELESVYFLSDKLFSNLGRRQIEIASSPIMPMHASSCELFFRDRGDRGGKSLLDIGCGAGGQSLLSARECSRVFGFDLDPRAVAFSRLNAALNGIDATFEVADALSFEAGAPFEHACFNADSIPDFRSPTSTDLGYELAMRVLGERFERILGPTGTCRTWVILFVGDRFATVEELLAHELAGQERFRISVTALPRSAFSVPAEQLARGDIARSCYLANDDLERAALLDFCRRNHVREITATVITTRLRRPGEAVTIESIQE